MTTKYHQKLRDRITVLLDQNPEGIELCSFWNVYHNRYREYPDLNHFKDCNRKSDLFLLFPEVCHISVKASKRVVVKGPSSSQIKTAKSNLEVKQHSTTSGPQKSHAKTDAPQKQKSETSLPRLTSNNSTTGVKSADKQNISSQKKTQQSEVVFTNSAIQQSADTDMAYRSSRNPNARQAPYPQHGHTHRQQSGSAPHQQFYAQPLAGHYQSHSSGHSSQHQHHYQTPSHQHQAMRSRDELERTAEECIERLSEEDEHVSMEKIEALLCKHYGVESISRLGIRYLDQLTAVHNHKRLVCKVNAYIQAFVKARSIATVHELRECLKDFLTTGNDFSDLKIGPLLKLPLVYEYFKTPLDGTILEITTLDIIEHLKHYLTANDKWRAPVNMEEFMVYLVDKYKVETGYHLGIRIQSMPLVMQVIKKAERERATTVREAIVIMKERTSSEVTTAFAQSIGSMLDYSKPKCFVRKMYMDMPAVKSVELIVTKFTALIDSLLYLYRENCASDKTTEHRLNKSKTVLKNFSDRILHDSLFCNLFRLAVCVSQEQLQVSVTEVFESVLDLKEETENDTDDAIKKAAPPLVNLVKEIKIYLERCLAAGNLDLKTLVLIEQKMLQTNEFSSFTEMKQGTFLEFLTKTKEIQQFFEEYGVMLSGGIGGGGGGGGSSGEGGGTYQVTHAELIKFIKQTHLIDHTNKTHSTDLSRVLCHHYGVNDVRLLQHGSIKTLMTIAAKKEQHDTPVYYEGALCASTKLEWMDTQAKAGKLGHQKKEHALSCLQQCPLLEDLSSWSHWPLVFQPQYGNIKPFIEKYGYVYTMSVKDSNGVSCELSTSICALELHPGTLIRISADSTPASFASCAAERDVRLTCAHLVSLIALNNGVEKTSLTLLGSNIEASLRQSAQKTRKHVNRGGDPWTEEQEAYAGAQFVLDCLVLLPQLICQAVADKVFLQPLSAVYGMSQSKHTLLQLSEHNTAARNRLQYLGLMLGVGEWAETIQQRMTLPEHCLLRNTDNMGDEPSSASRRKKSTAVAASSDSVDSDSDDAMADSSSDIEELLDSCHVDGEEDADTATTQITTETDDKDTEATTSSHTHHHSDKKDADDDKDDDDDEEVDVDDDDTKTNDPSQQPVDDIVSAGEALAQELECYAYIDKLRREEFGIGVQLTEDGQRLMDKQQQRLGRSLQRLSTDLYSKDTHFVLELIQNADDNAYPPDASQQAAILFLVEKDMISIYNNEVGFTKQQVKAVCDVGSSTKPKENAGYIGQKGIGFKSVFRITDRPEIHSNDFHWYFDMTAGPMGYILPHWIKPGDRVIRDEKLFAEQTWTTEIKLPLKPQSSSSALSVKFQDLHPSLLLFLHRLKRMIVVNQMTDSSFEMRRTDISDNIIEIEHHNKTERFLLARKLLNAEDISVKAKSGVLIHQTEIVLAFPVSSSNTVMTTPQKQPVFAFLPLRSYGFKFIIQADFEVPSSREDVNSDSMWNQWLREEIHHVFVEALATFQEHSGEDPIDSVCTFLSFVPLEDETLDFFKPVARGILRELRSQQCLPAENISGKGVEWKLPSQLVLIEDPLLRSVITPELLKDYLGLYMLNGRVSRVLNQSLCAALGVKTLNIDHLREAGKAIVRKLEEICDNESKDCLEAYLDTVKRWLVCVYRYTQDSIDNTEIYTELRQHRIIYLSNGSLVSLQEAAVFFPITYEEQSQQKEQKSTYLDALEADLQTLHSCMLTLDDNIQLSQLTRLLTDLGVSKLQPIDIINKHIVPTLSLEDDELLQSKKKELLECYIIYLKEELAQDASLLDISTLRKLAVVTTNKGVKRLCTTDIHFHTKYKPKVDVITKLPGYSWECISPVYIKSCQYSHDVQLWYDFFLKLGVVDGLIVKEKLQTFTTSQLESSPWSDCHIDLADNHTCSIRDFECVEFDDLVTRNTHSNTLLQQMDELYHILEANWQDRYASYTSTHVKNERGEVLLASHESHTSALPTSFGKSLRQSAWLPSLVVETSADTFGRANMSQCAILQKPSSLYVHKEIFAKLLHIHVSYFAIPPAHEALLQYVGVHLELQIPEICSMFLQEWCKTPDFVTSLAHMDSLYTFFHENLTYTALQDLLRNNNAIYYPKPAADVIRSRNDLVVGTFVSHELVWWNDPTQLFHKYEGELVTLNDAKKELKVHYPNDARFFIENAGVPEIPTLSEYLHLWCDLAENNLQGRVIEDVANLVDFLVTTFDSGGYQAIRYCMINTDMKHRKIIPTRKGPWASYNDTPMIADNIDFEKIFGNKDRVHLIDFSKGASKDETLKKIYNMLYACGLPRLNECVHIETVTEGYQECGSLQKYLHDVIPWLQKLLCAEHAELYRKLIARNVGETLAKLKCISVGRLELVHSLEHLRDVVHIEAVKCSFQEKECILYVGKDHMEDYKVINAELGNFFTANDKSASRSLRRFLDGLLPLLTSQSGELEAFLRYEDITDLPAGEKAWEVEAPRFMPPPRLPTPPSPPPTQYPMEHQSAGEVVAGDTGEQAVVKSWPPMSFPEATAAHNPRGGPKRFSARSEVWPLPSAPSYKDRSSLPDNIALRPRVGGNVDASGDDTASQSSDATCMHTSPHYNTRIIVPSSSSASQSSHQSTSCDNTHHPADTGNIDARHHSSTDSTPRVIVCTTADHHHPHREHDGSESRVEGDSTGRPPVTVIHEHVDDDGTGNPAKRICRDSHSVTDHQRDEEQQGGATDSVETYMETNHVWATWTQEPEELIYEELTFESDLVQMKEFSGPSSAHDRQIGKWGEELVYEYLQKEQKKPGSLIATVEWVQGHVEKGHPYEFVVTVKKEDSNEVNTIYIEVKTTRCTDKTYFPISINQVKFALKEQQFYHLYRVFGAGNTETARLTKITNLAQRLSNKQVGLMMYI